MNNNIKYVGTINYLAIRKLSKDNVVSFVRSSVYDQSKISTSDTDTWSVGDSAVLISNGSVGEIYFDGKEFCVVIEPMGDNACFCYTMYGGSAEPEKEEENNVC